PGRHCARARTRRCASERHSHHDRPDHLSGAEHALSAAARRRRTVDRDPPERSGRRRGEGTCARRERDRELGCRTQSRRAGRCPMNDGLTNATPVSDAGWYRRQTKTIGTITPSANIVVERVTQAILQDFPEVSAHYSRTPVHGSSDHYKDAYDLDGMLGAARLLAHARLDVICWNGSKG